MRFRFRGGEDCPDWVLAEISTISKLSAPKIKLVCLQILNHIEEEELKYEVFMKLIDDDTFTQSDVKGLVAALTFILRSSLRTDVESTSLDSELQQLGFPKEHSGILTNTYTEHNNKAREALRRSSLRYPAPTIEWTVDYIASSTSHGKIEEPLINLKINNTPCTLTLNKLDVLIAELKTASKCIKNIKL